MERRAFLTRHSKKPKGEDTESERYKGISKQGVELARQSTGDILRSIEESPKGAVIFLGGVSDEIRTRSTAEVYGDELKKRLAGREEYIVITREDVSTRKGYSAIANQIKGVIDANPNKKIIVDIPFFLKEFSLKRNNWLTKEGKPIPYFVKLMEKHNMDEYEIMKDWIKNQGETDGLKGPKPKEVAERYEKGIQRLERFAKKYVGDRPYVTGIVGHSFEADAYLTYLAGDGKVDIPTFEKVSSGKGMIKETELASVRISPNLTTISYRSKEHHRKKNLENLTGVLAVGSLLLSFFSFSGITGNVIGVGRNNNYGLMFVGIAAILGIFFVWLKKK